MAEQHISGLGRTAGGLCRLASLLSAAALISPVGCGEATEPVRNWACVQTEAEAAFLNEVGCAGDFESLASTPLDANSPGARSVKTVIDRVDDSRLYFQDSQTYAIHWDFASANLSGGALPVVPMLAEFNTTEYSSPSRRFVLGAVTHYEGPDLYVYEIAPYDNASAEMIVDAFERISASTYFGDRLRFFASSASIEATVAPVAEQLRVITSEELYEGIDYQPLNVAESMGKLVFLKSQELNESYLSFRDIAVLDAVPNDISVLSGIITEQFQTPLSHINVLSRNRGTPNMGLRGAFTDAELRALEGQWVHLVVGPSAYSVQAVSREEADAWWQQHRPTAVAVPGIDTTVQTLVDIEQTVDLEAYSVAEAVKVGTRAFGGKAAHYGALSHIPEVPTPKAFAVPVYFYTQFMQDNGFASRVQGLLDDPNFTGDAATRDQALQQLRDDMMATALEPEFLALVLDKLRTEYPGIRMRFRSSTNAEDLDGFTGAGLYTSKSGDPEDPERRVEDAIREVWASVWFFRAFEERSYRGIDHLSVAMALLVHRSFPDEEANGVALTNNPFDPGGLEPAFYVNVQRGDVSVVQPPVGITTESFLYYFDRQDQPITYISRSSLAVQGAPVLTSAQTYELGQALDRIRTFFAPAYGAQGTWWAMDVEFKFDGLPGQEPELFVKQARPYQ